MRKAFRCDIVKLDGPKIDHRGYLMATARLARSGIQEYLMPDGSIRRELRPKEEVFSEDSLQTLAGSAVTNDHPPTPLTADNTKSYSVGHLYGEPIKEDSDESDLCYIGHELTVWDSRTIFDVTKSGKNQISQGYFCDVELSPGIHPEFGPYDAIQRNIRHNHSAIVQFGRAGDTVKIKMDSKDNELEFAVSYKSDAKEKPMDESAEEEEEELEGEEEIEGEEEDSSHKKESKRQVVSKIKEAAEKALGLKQKKDGAKRKVVSNSSEQNPKGDIIMPVILNLDGVDFSFEDKLAGTIQVISTKLKGMEKLTKDNQDLAQKLDAQEKSHKQVVDELNAKVSVLEKLTQDEKEMSKLVQNRIDTLDFAKKVFKEETKMDELSTVELQKKLVKKLQPDMDVEKVDASYLKGVVSGLMIGFKTDASKILSEVVSKLDGGDKETKIDESFKNFQEKQANAYKGDKASA